MSWRGDDEVSIFSLLNFQSSHESRFKREIKINFLKIAMKEEICFTRITWYMIITREWGKLRLFIIHTTMKMKMTTTMRKKTWGKRENVFYHKRQKENFAFPAHRVRDSQSNKIFWLYSYHNLNISLQWRRETPLTCWRRRVNFSYMREKVDCEVRFNPYSHCSLFHFSLSHIICETYRLIWATKLWICKHFVSAFQRGLKRFHDIMILISIINFKYSAYIRISPLSFPWGLFKANLN